MSDQPQRLPAHLQALVDLLPLGAPVHRSEIERSYPKTNYARRIRKIVSEYGWDIERRRGTNGANDDWYTRKSDGPVKIAFLRREVIPSARVQIYKRDGWVCQACHTDVSLSQDLTRAQCDHKIPAERGGPSISSNLMTLCLRCNLKKRQTCKHCTLPSCDACPLAFPENFDDQIVMRVSKEVGRRLRDLEIREGMPLADLIKRLL